jgi:hypothetical protein
VEEGDSKIKRSRDADETQLKNMQCHAPPQPNLEFFKYLFKENTRKEIDLAKNIGGRHN